MFAEATVGPYGHPILKLGFCTLKLYVDMPPNVNNLRLSSSPSLRAVLS